MDHQTAAQTLNALLAQSSSSASSSSSSAIISSPVSSTITNLETTQTNTTNTSDITKGREINPTPFDKKVYTLLLQIPQGTTTTYSILAAILKSSPRAIGNSCRRNPFAPTVPCHRVVATGGGLGGFKGEHLSKISKISKITKSSVKVKDNSSQRETKWDKTLLTLDEKRKLLKKEGVKFDLKGEKVLGTPFAGFKV